MEKDNYARFKSTPIFKDMLRDLEVYDLSDNKRYSKIKTSNHTDIKSIRLDVREKIEEEEEDKRKAEEGRSTAEI